MKRKLDHAHDSTERLAIDVLAWLVGDEDRLLPFLNASGLSPGDIRQAAREPGFLGAVLDHVMGDEPVLVACAAALGVEPQRIASAWQRLQPTDFDHSL